jgi:hypothetical protein
VIDRKPDCGMEYFTDTVIRGLLAISLDPAQIGPTGFTDVETGKLIEMPEATEAGQAV